MRFLWLSRLCIPAVASLRVGAAAAENAAPASTPPSADAAASAPSSAGVAPVMLALRGDPLDVERVRALLAEELKRSVVLEHEAPAREVQGVVTVSYRKSSAELAVSWDAGGRTLTRL